MFGLLIAEQADEAVIVTSGTFSRDAQSFAEGKPIRLVDGPQLLSLVQFVQDRSSDLPTVAEMKSDSVPAPACPSCGKPMVLRIARRGSNAGNRFWGCPGFPNCKGTREF
jgi:restriction system protein